MDETNKAPAKLELGPAVIEIRALVREGLYETIPALESLAQAQRTRSDAMIEAFRRRVEPAKSQAQLQLNARTFALVDDRNEFIAALAVAQTVQAKIETPVDQLRSLAQKACAA